ncbi:MAG: PilT/PilU family type 4a pilus ATPase [Elusimicrobia bacterium]|nr:PilT/PilU family type 4a pilus ATPase [Elusimicrobiota bacterium]
MASPEYDLTTLLQDVVARGGSDLHLIHGIPPIARISGEIGALPYSALASDGIKQLLEPYMNDYGRDLLKKDMRLNFSHTLNDVGRFRFALYQALGTLGATIRVIPTKTYPLSALGLPPVVGTLANRRSGVIFVTGATGSGKSTTMAAMIEYINQTGRPGKVITIEDPIETIFKPCRSVFVQREVGVDTPTFDSGTLDALRQDPDILCIGEMRDGPSIKAALLAAETGHLVLTTLHTRDASKTAQRIVTAVSQPDQESLREQLAMTLEAVISQDLLPRADGKGLVVAVEILIANTAVRQLIRENKLDAINDAIQSGLSVGMISRDSSIKNLFQKKLITREVAVEHMRNPDLLGK